MLVWIVEGAVFAFEAGDGEVPVVDWCDVILDATKAWRDGEDVIHRFIDDALRRRHW